MGFGDVVGLMTDFQKVVDEETAEADARKLLSGKFNMWDFLEQIRTIKKMGPLKDLLEKLPFFADSLPEGVKIDDKALTRIEAMIQSMTAQERDKPELIEKQPRRALRIGKGSGIPKAGDHRARPALQGDAQDHGRDRLAGRRRLAEPAARLQTDVAALPVEEHGPRQRSGRPRRSRRPWEARAARHGWHGWFGYARHGRRHADARAASRDAPGLPKGYLPPGMPGAPRKNTATTQAKKEAERKKQKAAKASRKQQRKKK
jgi:hypothetical protein